MKTMFKKTLVAAALVSLGFAAQAADVTTAVANISKQGSVTADQTAGTVLVKLEAAYAVGDTIKINVTGGLKSAPLTLTSVTGAADARFPTNRVTLGRIGLDATSATYRVTEISGAGAAHGYLRFGTGVGAKDNVLATDFADTQLVFKAADVVAAGKVNLTYTAFIGSTSNALDTPVEYNGDDELTSGAVFNVRDQFKAAVSAANVFKGVLDVANDRKQFSSNGTTATTDTAIITLTNNADTGAVTKTNTFVTVKGDFSWAADASVATVTCTGGAASDAKKITASALTFGCDAATTSITLVLNLDQAEDVSVNPTTFAVDVNHVYGTGSILTNTDVAAGEWTVDGSNITIPYMAYGSIGTKTFSQIVNLTNTGSQTGTIYADVWSTDAAGKSVKLLTNANIGTSYPKATAKIAGALKTALEAKGFKDGTVAIRLITDVKADTVSVYSAYVDNGTSERAIVNNDSPVTQK